MLEIVTGHSGIVGVYGDGQLLGSFTHRADAELFLRCKEQAALDREDAERTCLALSLNGSSISLAPKVEIYKDALLAEIRGAAKDTVYTPPLESKSLWEKYPFTKFDPVADPWAESNGPSDDDVQPDVVIGGIAKHQMEDERCVWCGVHRDHPDSPSCTGEAGLIARLNLMSEFMEMAVDDCNPDQWDVLEEIVSGLTASRVGVRLLGDRVPAWIEAVLTGVSYTRIKERRGGS